MSGGFLGRLFGRGQNNEQGDRLVVPAPPTSEDLLASLDRVESMVAAGAVPAPVASRVRRVDQVVRDTIPRLPSLGAGSPQAYSVMATATDYLPEAVGGYLRLPRQFADNRPVDRGKSSLMVLIDQLDLLAATMDKVFDAVCRADADALVAHGRFLSEKFGSASTGGALDVGSAPVPPMPGTPASPRTGEDAGGLGRAAAAGRAGRVMSASRPPSPSSPPRTTTLAEAVDAVAALAVAAGADDTSARQEALALAAAVAESAPGAAADWRAAAGGASTQDFFDAASRGRRWRGAPTATLGLLAAQQSPYTSAYAQALAEVAAAACELGEPTMRVIGNASVAAAAQLSAVQPEPARGTSVAEPVGGPSDNGPRQVARPGVPAARRPDRSLSAVRRRRQADAAATPAATADRHGASTSCWPSSTPSSACSGSSARSTGRSPCCGSRSCAWMPA